VDFILEVDKALAEGRPTFASEPAGPSTKPEVVSKVTRSLQSCRYEEEVNSKE